MRHMSKQTPTTPEPGKSLQIFRAGKHITSDGTPIEFSQADVAATVAAYDPKLHEAPIVVGHPKNDGPAYGWVSALKLHGSNIEADADQVEPQFGEMVKAGRFKHISASFYAPEAPNNPKPGVYYLRHVGFLGAEPPAIKGLRTPQFSDGEAGVVSFSDFEDLQNAGLWRGLREWLIAKFGLVDADQVVPAWTVRNLEQSAMQPEPVAAGASTATSVAPFFNDPKGITVTEAEAAQLRQKNDEQAARIKALEAADAARAGAQRHAEHVAFAEALTGIPAGQRPLLVAALDALATQPVEFGEGDAKGPLLTQFKGLLKGLPPVVNFGESATTAKAAAGAGGAGGAGAPGASVTVSFSAPQGYTVEPVSMSLHLRALQHQAQNKGCSYIDAVRAVS